MSHSSESVIAADEVNKTLRHNESFLALAVVHLKINKPRCFLIKLICLVGFVGIVSRPLAFVKHYFSAI